MACSPIASRIIELCTWPDQPHDAHKLTFWAEEVGRLALESGDERFQARACGSLLRLLDHQDALVREGAVYGLSHFVSIGAVAQRLMRVGWEDASQGVRAAANDAVDDQAFDNYFDRTHPRPA